jgi:hypothetical protein
MPQTLAGKLVKSVLKQSLRIYPTTGADAIARETQFHELLEAADHDRSRARTGGTEWFLTSLRFLDVVAKTIGLEIRRVYDPDEE